MFVCAGCVLRPGVAGRGALAVTKTPCVAFVIPRLEYLAIREVVRGRPADRADDAKLLASLPWCQGVASDTVVNAAFRCRTVAAARGSTIVAEGSGETQLCPPNSPISWLQLPRASLTL